MGGANEHLTAGQLEGAPFPWGLCLGLRPSSQRGRFLFREGAGPWRGSEKLMGFCVPDPRASASVYWVSLRPERGKSCEI